MTSPPTISCQDSYIIPLPDFMPFLLQNYQLLGSLLHNTYTWCYAISVADEEPPTISCPDSYIIYLQEGTPTTSVTFDILSLGINTSDNVGIASNNVAPNLLNFTPADIGSSVTIIAEVRDAANNFATCEVQIKIEGNYQRLKVTIQGWR